MTTEQQLRNEISALAELYNGQKEYVAELEAKLAKANICEVCKDVLAPQPPRCEKHVHTEPGDDDWED